MLHVRRDRGFPVLVLDSTAACDSPLSETPRDHERGRSARYACSVFIEKPAIIRFSQSTEKHYLMVFCLTVICYLDSTSATAIDAIAFNKGVERKETPSSIPA